MGLNLFSRKFSNVFVILFLLSFVIGSCSKDDGPTGTEPSPIDLSGFTIYKNQTGNPDADALQAHYEDDNHTINFYGNFNNYDEPAITKTLTFQKKNNDTLVNFILDPITSRISSSFVSVNGEKLPVVMKFTYPEEGSGSISISLYEYSWTDHTGALFFSTTITDEIGGATNNTSKTKSYPLSKRNYSNFTKSSESTLNAIAWLAGGIGAGIAAAEGAVALKLIGGKSLIAAAAAGTTASAVAAVAVPVAVAAAIGVTLLTLTAIINDADASELVPSDGPYPEGVPVHNPIPEGEDPSPNLEESGCFPNDIGFTAFMDQEGTISLKDISGGEPPYTYFVNSDVQDAPTFGNDYPDGNYMVSVKDANGCMKSIFVPLSREEVSLKVTHLSGGSLSSPLELVNNTPSAMKLVDGQGNDFENFDISKLSIRNISNNEVKIHAQKNGQFSGGEGGEYFEIIALTDVEDAETSFDIYYDGVWVDSLQAIIKKRTAGRLFAVSWYKENLFELDPYTGGILREIDLSSLGISEGDYSMEGFAYSQRTNEIIFLPFSHTEGVTLSRINVDTGEETRIYNAETEIDRHDMDAVVTLDERLFVRERYYNNNGKITELDINDGSVIKVLGEYGTDSSPMWYLEKTKEIGVINSEGQLIKIDIDDGQERIFELPPGSWRSFIPSKTGRLFLVGYDILAELDPYDHSIISTIPIPDTDALNYLTVFVDGTDELIGDYMGSSLVKLNIETGEMTTVTSPELNELKDIILFN